MIKRIIPIAALVLLFSGCAHVVSKETRETAKPDIPVEDLFKNPAAYKGRTVILGGTIISAVNSADGTYVEVLERPLDSLGKPRNVDTSRGRFIVFSEGYLDTALYASGRMITAAGTVTGKEMRPLGETQYPYLRLKAKELYLIKSAETPVRFFFGVGVRQSL